MQYQLLDKRKHKFKKNQVMPGQIYEAGILCRPGSLLFILGW